MAQKPPKKLSFVEIVMGADAEVIRTAYEARVKIDGLLTERDAAYRKILDIENQIEGVIGEEGAFVYPPPPAPVAGIAKLEPATRKTADQMAPKPVAPRKPSVTPADVPETKEKAGKTKA